MSRPRTSLPLIFSAFLAAAALSGDAAFADPAPPTTDPMATVTAGYDAGMAVWTQDGPIWAGLVVMMLVLRTFLDRQHWIRQGRVLAGLTGLAAVIAATLNWHLNGAPAAGIITAIVAALALIQHPTAGSPAPGPLRLPQSGRAGTGVMILLAVGAAITLTALASSCTASQRSTVKTAGHEVVVCAKADAPAIAALVAKLGVQATLDALGMGSINWDGIEADAWTQGKVVGGCALAQFIDQIAKARGQGPAVASLRDPAADGLAALEHFRGRLGGTVQWDIGSGTR